MPYIERNQNNQIIALFAEAPSGDAEYLPSSDIDVMGFLNSSPTDEHSIQFLTSSDYELVRVLEDLIEVLVEKDLLLFTELPVAAQKKLMQRRSVRKNLSESGGLMVDENDIL